MWVTEHAKWNKNSTSLERFFFERIIQRCDYNESISKKHRTINGLTQLYELIKLAELSKKRIRTLRTLCAIIKEAKSAHIKQNIKNDLIIDRYFSDLKFFICNFNEDEAFKNDSLDKIENFIHTLKKHAIQLEKNYFKNILTELYKIEIHNNDLLETKTDQITKTVDILIPYLLYKGYSINTINEVLRRWIEGGKLLNLKEFFDFFNFEKHNYEMFVNLKKTKEIDEIKNVIYKNAIGDIRSASEFNDEFEPRKNFSHRDLALYFNTTAMDPVSFMRNQYELLLRSIVISRDRESLTIFTDFFKNSYWRKSNSKYKHFKTIIINGDPINVKSRKSTLFLSLTENPNIDFRQNSTLNFVEDLQLKKSIYYYNLAIGSKSIENSLSLMWTAIETALPYRTHKSDVENVKDLFSKLFSFGSIARDIQYLIKRIQIVNKVNKQCFRSIGLEDLPSDYHGENLFTWFDWLATDTEIKFAKFNSISLLLASEYLKTIKPLTEGKLSSLLERINASKESIGFQIQRIYLHRNQIVHSGDYINEYTNLWIHQEWYIGKFLAFIILNTEKGTTKKSIPEACREIESEFEYCFSYLEKNSSKRCKDSTNIIRRLLAVDWQ